MPHNGLKKQELLKDYYHKMLDDFGPRGWWPGETTLEICIGAILTQSVAWKNVVKAINNLQNSGLLDLNHLYNCQVEEIEQCIVPTLYFRQKAKKIKSFVNYVVEQYHGDLDAFLKRPLPELRNELLNLFGIGPETADSILLYAAKYPIFVVDAYTRRIFSRLGVFNQDVSYDEMQNYFMKHLSTDVKLFNEYHALIVGVGNHYCATKKPKCESCPIRSYCRFTA